MRCRQWIHRRHRQQSLLRYSRNIRRLRRQQHHVPLFTNVSTNRRRPVSTDRCRWEALIPRFHVFLLSNWLGARQLQKHRSGGSSGFRRRREASAELRKGLLLGKQGSHTIQDLVLCLFDWRKTRFHFVQRVSTHCFFGLQVDKSVQDLVGSGIFFSNFYFLNL